jgi:hypothetical protein
MEREKEIMKKVLCVIALLMMVASASASVRVFVTSSADPYGLTIPANAFQPTYSTVYSNNVNENAYDYYYGNGPFVAAAFPPVDAPSGDLLTPVDIQDGNWAYIWFQFQDEPKLRKINGLEVTISYYGTAYDPNEPSTHPPVATNYYLCNDKQSSGKKRYDGTATPPGYPEWHNNLQVLVAVDANGIVNGVDDPVLMYHFQTGGNPRTGVALLGAVAAPFDGTIYEIAITDVNYSEPPHPEMAPAAVFRFVPEPASLVLLALAGLVLRRR